MNYRINRKQPVVLGLLLIVFGIFLKRFVELTLVSDTRIESPAYVAVIIVIQLLAVISGILLIIKQPSIRIPSKTELILLAVSVGLTFSILEIGSRIWLRYLATPEQYDRFVLFTEIKPENFA